MNVDTGFGMVSEMSLGMASGSRPGAAPLLTHGCVLSAPLPDGVTAQDLCAGMEALLEPARLEAALPDLAAALAHARQAAQAPRTRLRVEFHLLAHGAHSARARLVWVLLGPHEGPDNGADNAADPPGPARGRHMGPVLESVVTGTTIRPDFHHGLMASLLKATPPPPEFVAALAPQAGGQ